MKHKVDLLAEAIKEMKKTNSNMFAGGYVNPHEHEAYANALDDVWGEVAFIWGLEEELQG